MRKRVKREYLLQVMRDASFNTADAAKAANVNRQHFQHLLRQYDVRQECEDELSKRYVGTMRDALRKDSRDYLKAVMANSATMSEAARVAGVGRQSFYRLVRCFDAGQSINPAHRGCWHLYGL